MSPTHRAFTLIELLVVVTIVLILAAIALPVYLSVQEKGRASSDLNNIRQLALGTVAYANDNGDTLFDPTGATAWPKLLNPTSGASSNTYVTEWKIFKSPFDPRPGGGPEPVAVSYGINAALFQQDPQTKRYQNDVSRFNAISSLILFAPFAGERNAWPGTSETNVTVSSFSNAKGTHGSGALINVAFADAHVATLKFKQFQDVDSDDDAKRRWNPGFGQ